ncbi:hypothetical protein AXF42_Ash011406 [Apostasia shenzhenica]|uniref:Retrotransposon gag domain-containing protein n=1 Tax=Apostasia shenzhenica TaxID=1088818 RepID=A0A2I0AEJ0_9ASPA|nr:hypothetical protein AXF42_Ash011406 [Apostasia shenzhenica]
MQAIRNSSQQISMSTPSAGIAIDRVLKMFKDMRPPYFDGKADPFIAEDWLEEIENIFEAMECPDEKKVILATTAMRKDAQYWWKSECRTRFAGRSQHDIT